MRIGYSRRDFPTTLQALRRRLGKTQQETAALLGVREETVREWEKGHHEPTAASRQAVEKLAHEVFREPDPTAQKIRRLRHRLGLTQREFVARLAVKRKTVSRWECGQQRPSFEALERMERLNESAYSD